MPWSNRFKLLIGSSHVQKGDAVPVSFYWFQFTQLIYAQWLSLVSYLCLYDWFFLLFLCSTPLVREYIYNFFTSLFFLRFIQVYYDASSLLGMFMYVLNVIFSALCCCFVAIFDRSGRYVITGSDDRLVKIWSMETAFCLTSCRGHEVNFASYLSE